VLCDADLAILAAASDRYTQYATAIRQEYAHIPDVDFRAGRAKVLRRFLDRPTIYRTAHGRQHWEAAARANISTEIAALESSDE
jgi:predicted metal-dependent HD superfamily phosphohydrolase